MPDSTVITMKCTRDLVGERSGAETFNWNICSILMRNSKTDGIWKYMRDL